MTAAAPSAPSTRRSVRRGCGRRWRDRRRRGRFRLDPLGYWTLDAFGQAHRLERGELLANPRLQIAHHRWRGDLVVAREADAQVVEFIQRLNQRCPRARCLRRVEDIQRGVWRDRVGFDPARGQRMALRPATGASERRALLAARLHEHRLETSALSRHPLVERRTVVDVDAVEERTAIQLDDARKVAGFRGIAHLERVDIERRVGREGDVCVAGGDGLLTERAPERRERVAERVAGTCLGPLCSPQKSSTRVSRETGVAWPWPGPRAA